MRMLKTCCDRVVRQFSFLKTKHCLISFLASLSKNERVRENSPSTGKQAATYPQKASMPSSVLTLENLSLIRSRPLIVFSTSPPASKHSFLSERFCDFTLPTRRVQNDQFSRSVIRRRSHQLSGPVQAFREELTQEDEESEKRESGVHGCTLE